MSAVIPKSRWLAFYLIAVATLVLCLAQGPGAHAGAAKSEVLGGSFGERQGTS